MNRENLAAIDGALACNPRHVAALIAKADHLVEVERRLISTLFEAVDARGGARVAWSV
jgi:hypothetical protein